MTARVWAGLATIYVVWGSTYLGIMVAIETLPPFLMSSVRFLIAGALLYAWSVRRGDREADRPGRREWAGAALIGFLLLVVGTGGVAWAEQRVDSGVAALIVATIPLWVALFGFALFRRKLGGGTLLGLAVGFGGVALLVGADAGVDRFAGTLLVFTSAAWSLGTVLAPRLTLPRRPLVGAAMQMLTAGAAMALVGVALGELGRVEAPSARSLVALAYLIVFGSLVAFSAYVWLLGAAPASVVATYAFVNPVVAVLLGAAFLDEAIGVTTVIAGGAIVVAVALIVAAPSLPRLVRRARDRRKPVATLAG